VLSKRLRKGDALRDWISDASNFPFRGRLAISLRHPFTLAGAVVCFHTTALFPKMEKITLFRYIFKPSRDNRLYGFLITDCSLRIFYPFMRELVSLMACSKGCCARLDRLMTLSC
jgi:hypothetical protein